MHSQWLQTTVSGVHDKMKDIVNLLEHKDVSYKTSKESITKIVKDLCISYCSLAHDYEYLKSITTSENTLNSTKQKYVSQSWDDSHPESTVEDAESESEDVTSELLDHLKKSVAEDAESESEDVTSEVVLDHLKTSVAEDAESESEGFTSTEFDHLKTMSGEGLVLEGESGIETEKGFLDTMFEYSKLIEENTSVQMELIRRNSEKREMIIELRDQVRRLVSEKDMLQRQLSYYERNIVGVSSPSRRTIFRDKIFKCST